MSNLKHNFVHTNGIRLHYVEAEGREAQDLNVKLQPIGTPDRHGIGTHTGIGTGKSEA